MTLPEKKCDSQFWGAKTKARETDDGDVFHSIQAQENGLAVNNFRAIPKSETFGCFQKCFFF